MEDGINTSRPVPLNRELEGGFCNMWPLNCGQAPDHPLFDSPSCYRAHVGVGALQAQTSLWPNLDHRPANELLMVTS